MSKFYGISPQPATQQAIETFEDKVLIRKDNRYLISTVYLDMREDRWAIAIAHSSSKNPGLHGQENILEVRYSYENRRGNTVTMFRSDMAEESTITTRPFPDPDTFAQ